MQYKKIKLSFLNTSSKEIHDLFKAWIIISLAFAIAIKGFSLSFSFLLAVIVSSLTVGTAFILHEMGHKIMAQKYGCFAEFRSFDNMLFLALLMSFFGFVFAAPGAVMISGPIGRRRNGKISAMGPGVNLGLALIFLIISLSVPIAGIRTFSYYGLFINSWLALFNMIPLAMFDGRKILHWNKIVYGVMVAVALLLMMTLSIVGQGINT